MRPFAGGFLLSLSAFGYDHLQNLLLPVSSGCITMNKKMPPARFSRVPWRHTFFISSGIAALSYFPS